MTTFYTPEEIAEATRMSRSWVYEEIRAGRLRAVRLGSRLRVSLQDLGAYLDAQRVEPQKPDEPMNLDAVVAWARGQ